jgi:hypothetical protein
MMTVSIGEADITRVRIPRCSGCSRHGHDFRCDCAGTGYRLECRQCGDTVRDKDAHGYRVQFGKHIDCYICDKDECFESTETELIEMQRPAREGRAA